MSRIRHLARFIISIGTTVLLLGTSHAAQAGSFSDAFKNFVLGSEANAGTLPAVQLPASSQSRTCMQCHNGSGGPHINMKPAGSPMQFSGMSIDHPVGMDYNQYAYKHPESYVRPARMDTRILFEDGKVTCVSCHQTETSPAALPGIAQADTPHCNVGTGYTTGSNNRTRLCLGCHTM
ncbi:MAG TPA: hypothetical protein ENJ80_00990 [Gammaproteobacteria bacterium]|nr:hypothetical protein [Gammaproteobacteria bacterium]